MDIVEAVSAGKLDNSELAKTYDRFIDFLNNEPSGGRILLYFPFELIPDKDWQPASSELAGSIKRFRDIYTKKWHELLHVQDVRANFSDGDVLEPELRDGPVPRVSKVAHFIPILVKKGILSTQEVISIAENNHDEIIEDSIIDSFGVLDDLGLLTDENMRYMQKSSDKLLRDTAMVIKNADRISSNKPEDVTATEKDKDWLIGLVKQIQDDRSEIRARLETQKNVISKPRADWEKLRDEQGVVEMYSEEIASAMTEGSISAEDINNFISSNTDKVCVLTGIASIKRSLEKMVTKNPEQAREAYETFIGTFVGLWEQNDPAIQDAIEHALSHLLALKIADKKDLERLGIEIPDLGEGLQIKDDETVTEFSDIAKTIEENEELSRFVFPIVIAYGSKVKGYGRRMADKDIAVFIRPDVTDPDKPKIKNILDEMCKKHNIKGEALEFWLENKEVKTGEEAGGLKIKDSEDPKSLTGRSTFTHVLFKGVWCGQKEAMEELYAKLLSGYLKPDKTDEEKEMRRVCLEEMERDTLQYRLMHKGYANFYPERGGIHTKHSANIDSESAFWDSGYRRLATKLFLRKVFLPQSK